RIFAIADTFDAITSNRPYRRGAPVEAARAEIQRCKGSQFDRECVEAFLSFSIEELAALARPAPRP
ncbi:MAG TPA: two-component system response regulator, partial [Anaeromyxobacteraceae bacterium]|nr:two-component system response regulator [Anaeromyxobacteraceae bacterium]